MMKNLYRAFFCLFTILSLSACNSVSLLDKNTGDNQNETCNYLKRQMTYNSRSNAADSRFIAASQTQELKDQYEEYGCK